MRRFLSGSALALVATTSHAQGITVLVEGGGLQLQQEMAEAFTAETGIEVTFTEVPYQGVYDRLSAEIASGTSTFDVATIDVVWNSTFAPHLEDLSDLFTDEVRADLAPALLADAEVDGRMIGMPAWANAEIVFYRRDLFEDPAEMAAFEAEYGYPLAPPATWEQWRDVAKFFTRDTDGDGATDLYGTSTIGLFAEEWMAHVLQAGSPGVILDDEGQVIIDNAQHVAALDFYRAPLCDDGSVPPNALEIGWGEAQNLFYQGQMAMMKFWAHAYRLTPEDSAVDGLVGVAPMIAGEAGVAGIPGPWYNVIPSTAANKDEARQFVAYAIAHNAIGIEAPLGLAAANSAYEEYMGEPGFEHFGPLLETLGAPATRGRPLHPDYQEVVDEAVLPAVQEALSCERPSADILADAADTVADIVE